MSADRGIRLRNDSQVTRSQGPSKESSVDKEEVTFIVKDGEIMAVGGPEKSERQHYYITLDQEGVVPPPFDRSLINKAERDNEQHKSHSYRKQRAPKRGVRRRSMRYINVPTRVGIALDAVKAAKLKANFYEKLYQAKLAREKDQEVIYEHQVVSLGRQTLPQETKEQCKVCKTNSGPFYLNQLSLYFKNLDKRKEHILQSRAKSRDYIACQSRSSSSSPLEDEEQKGLWSYIQKSKNCEPDGSMPIFRARSTNTGLFYKALCGKSTPHSSLAASSSSLPSSESPRGGPLIVNAVKDWLGIDQSGSEFYGVDPDRLEFDMRQNTMNDFNDNKKFRELRTKMEAGKDHREDMFAAEKAILSLKLKSLLYGNLYSSFHKSSAHLAVLQTSKRKKNAHFKMQRCNASACFKQGSAKHVSFIIQGRELQCSNNRSENEEEPTDTAIRQVTEPDNREVKSAVLDQSATQIFVEMTENNVRIDPKMDSPRPILLVDSVINDQTYESSSVFLEAHEHIAEHSIQQKDLLICKPPRPVNFSDSTIAIKKINKREISNQSCIAFSGSDHRRSETMFGAKAKITNSRKPKRLGSRKKKSDGSLVNKRSHLELTNVEKGQLKQSISRRARKKNQGINLGEKVSKTRLKVKTCKSAGKFSVKGSKTFIKAVKNSNTASKVSTDKKSTKSSKKKKDASTQNDLRLDSGGSMFQHVGPKDQKITNMFVTVVGYDRVRHCLPLNTFRNLASVSSLEKRPIVTLSEERQPSPHRHELMLSDQQYQRCESASLVKQARSGLERNLSTMGSQRKSSLHPRDVKYLHETEKNTTHARVSTKNLPEMEMGLQEIKSVVHKRLYGNVSIGTSSNHIEGFQKYIEQTRGNEKDEPNEETNQAVIADIEDPPNKQSIATGVAAANSLPVECSQETDDCSSEVNAEGSIFGAATEIDIWPKVENFISKATGYHRHRIYRTAPSVEAVTDTTAEHKNTYLDMLFSECLPHPSVLSVDPSQKETPKFVNIEVGLTPALQVQDLNIQKMMAHLLQARKNIQEASLLPAVEEADKTLSDEAVINLKSTKVLASPAKVKTTNRSQGTSNEQLQATRVIVNSKIGNVHPRVSKINIPQRVTSLNDSKSSNKPPTNKVKTVKTKSISQVSTAENEKQYRFRPTIPQKSKKKSNENPFSKKTTVGFNISNKRNSFEKHEGKKPQNANSSIKATNSKLNFRSSDNSRPEFEDVYSELPSEAAKRQKLAYLNYVKTGTRLHFPENKIEVIKYAPDIDKETTDTPDDSSASKNIKKKRSVKKAPIKKKEHYVENVRALASKGSKDRNVIRTRSSQQEGRLTEANKRSNPSYQRNTSVKSSLLENSIVSKPIRNKKAWNFKPTAKRKGQVSFSSKFPSYTLGMWQQTLNKLVTLPSSHKQDDGLSAESNRVKMESISDYTNKSGSVNIGESEFSDTTSTLSILPIYGEFSILPNERTGESSRHLTIEKKNEKTVRTIRASHDGKGDHTLWLRSTQPKPITKPTSMNEPLLETKTITSSANALSLVPTHQRRALKHKKFKIVKKSNTAESLKSDKMKEVSFSAATVNQLMDIKLEESILKNLVKPGQKLLTMAYGQLLRVLHINSLSYEDFASAVKGMIVGKKAVKKRRSGKKRQVTKNKAPRIAARPVKVVKDKETIVSKESASSSCDQTVSERAAPAVCGAAPAVCDAAPVAGGAVPVASGAENLEKSSLKSNLMKGAEMLVRHFTQSAMR